MGLYLSAVDWFATSGAGTYGDGLRDERGGTLDRLRGRGEAIAVPKGENAAGVNGSGVMERFVGWDVRIGAMMAPDWDDGSE